MIGKFAQGLKGFPTPNTATGIAGYLLFYFDDKEWAQYILGAARALGDPFNWYEAGDMSTEDAAEAFRVIVQDAPYNLRSCPNPAGGRIFRVNALGKVQELSDAGTWEEPSGDATIPPVPEREGGTPPDQMCLAAKNATHVLELLYENVTDSFNEGLDEAETATALTLAIITLIGAEFAPITFALVTFFGIVFSVLYGTLEFVGADLWDENFTEALYCMLLSCASNDDGVVTFDWECFQAALAAQTTVVPLEFTQLRLFGQLEYLLQVIGGVDALNQAGATTEITDDDCSACTGWCYRFEDGARLDEWTSLQWAASGADTPAVYSAGEWHSGYNTGAHNVNFIHLRWVNDDTVSLDDAGVMLADIDVENRTIWINGDGTTFSGTQVYNNGVWSPSSPVDVDSIDVVCWRSIDQGVNPFSLDWIQESGSVGDNPYGDNNCP